VTAYLGVIQSRVPSANGVHLEVASRVHTELESCVLNDKREPMSLTWSPELRLHYEMTVINPI